MPTSTIDYDDFLDELPTAVMVKRLIDEVLAEMPEEPCEEVTEELDPSEFRAIGTR
ncbi:MAG: hypothetical protein M4D80_16420 [Myxococcota bacterium]|nr:hypothetical protein [Deltaproteobacteria bacterium]MDQ3336751.1 hypothetical protein [Myxococcota bacterium]